MGTGLLTALGLMLVLEGILPFMAPQIWRETLRKAIALRDGQLRFLGLVSMLVGLALVALVR